MADDTHEAELFALGTQVAPWMVKGFSVALRERITDLARRQGVTTAEWLHSYFQRHGLDGQQVTVVKIDQVNRLALPAPSSPQAHHAELHDLAQLARGFTPDGKDSEAMRLGRSLVRDRLKALRAVEGDR